MDMFEVCLAKKINLHSVKENWILDNSLNSKVTRTIFALVAEIERDFISQRTKEALKVKKEQGIKLGRPKGSGSSKLDKYREEIEALLKNGSSQKHLANKYNTTEANFSRWMKKHGIKKV